MYHSRPIIVLLRHDLRLADNPALWHAAETRSPLLFVYILDDKTPGQWKIGEAQRWWLHHSLKAFQKALNTQHSTLILKRGETLAILKDLVSITDPHALYFNRCYEPFWLNTEKQLCHSSLGQSLTIRAFNSALFVKPGTLLTKQGTPYKVFSQFWKALEKDLDVAKPHSIPSFIPYSNTNISSESLEDWDLLPTHPNWAAEFSTVWEPGEVAADKKLTLFLKNHLSTYQKERDIPSSNGTSLLSPHLHFGEISLRQIFHGLPKESPGKETFLRELGWREFSYHLLFHFPDFPEKPFQAQFERFPWKTDASILKAWQQGRVGYPIVDAGMRQLWHIGYMHNRVRMIVASFLTKDLLIPWQEGETWFWNTLVDADLANNAMNWQWTAGCGVDAAPFFRIFNPTTQGEKFDPEGTYIKKWVPELSQLPAKFIHKPWEAPPHILKDAGVQLGKNYPYPIVDHTQARTQALNYFKKLRH